MLGRVAKEAKEVGNPKEKNLVKAGQILIVITRGLLMISDILDYRKKKLK